MDKFQYVSVNSVLAKFHRDFRGVDINESDAIDWAGEALGFMKIAAASEEAICFAEVKNHELVLPNTLHYIIQVAVNNTWESSIGQDMCIPQKVICNMEEELFSESDCDTGYGKTCVVVDRFGRPIFDDDFTYYMPEFHLQADYNDWRSSSYSRQGYTPVKLADHTFFNTLVCQDPDDAHVYRRGSMGEEYTIVGGNTLRFSFKEGMVAVAYLRQKVDEDGYPMIPDDSYAINALTYYIIWKIKQRECYLHREGACQLAEKAQSQWDSYILKFKNKAKMPHGLDQHQSIMEATTYLIPRRSRHLTFFGKLQ